MAEINERSRHFSLTANTNMFGSSFKKLGRLQGDKNGGAIVKRTGFSYRKTLTPRDMMRGGGIKMLMYGAWDRGPGVNVIHIR